jgi:hypothetical protein
MEKSSRSMCARARDFREPRSRRHQAKQENQFNAIYAVAISVRRCAQAARARRRLFDDNNVIIGNCMLGCAKKAFSLSLPMLLLLFEHATQASRQEQRAASIGKEYVNERKLCQAAAYT